MKLPIGKHYIATRNLERLREVLDSNEKLQTCYTLCEMLKSSLYCRNRGLFIDGFNRWLAMAKNTGYEELKRFSNMIDRHWEGILTRTEYSLSNGPLEGTNCLIKNIRRKSYGIRDDEYFFLKIWEATRRHPKNRVVYESPHFLARANKYYNHTVIQKNNWMAKSRSEKQSDTPTLHPAISNK